MVQDHVDKLARSTLSRGYDEAAEARVGHMPKPWHAPY